MGIRTAIVAINQLPPIPETLLIRLLGKGATQKQAIDEIQALAKENTLRQYVTGLLYRWRIYLETQTSLTEDEEELLMNIEAIYQQHKYELRQQGLLEGLQQGHLEERRLFVENLLSLKFGFLDETLLQLIESLQKLPPNESSRLIWQCSREELIKKLSH